MSTVTGTTDRLDPRSDDGPRAIHAIDDAMILTEAARRFGIDQSELRKMVRRGVLVGEQRMVRSHWSGRDRPVWYVSVRSIEEWTNDPKVIARRQARLRVREELTVTTSIGGKVRFPLQPLRNALESLTTEGEVSSAVIASRVGTQVSQVQRARSEGLTVWLADRWSVAAGYHPGEIWGEAWWNATEVVLPGQGQV